ncbi:thioredoxin-like protein [Plenodomus tracheiphilus IPT5]|uniref:Glutathione peroxidase n=1 Tax=Plenodomus tracheiphilus IPT5 TaxID=1408161 RepID=A0A6A7B839_9PLEO|nr:thioredoxin-like protein [Plenodomus tracheiphilus IPT5]
MICAARGVAPRIAIAQAAKGDASSLLNISRRGFRTTTFATITTTPALSARPSIRANTTAHAYTVSTTSSPTKTTITTHGFATMASATSFYDFKPKDKRDQPYDLSALSGKVVLVVNTASKCGFTPQFAGLEKLYKDIKAGPHGDNFEILGFPCNQFGGQDPGSNDEIQEFCQLNYGVSFPVLGKIDVNGDKADPAFEWLKNEKPGLMGLKRVKWNFEKFLVGKDGKVKARWASTKKPEDLKKDIEEALKA